MGVLSTLLPGIRANDLAAAAASVGVVPSRVPLSLASPWASPNQLAHVVWSDVFGTRLVAVTRAEAMSVPAVARARHILAGFARIQLRAYQGTARLEGAAAPTWIAATNAVLSPWHRMAWTLDDLLFYGWSCWSAVIGADRKPYQLDRLPQERWAWGQDSEGRRIVLIDDEPAHPDSYVLIPGPHEGILSNAADSIRHAADLQRAAGQAAKHPSAYLALKQTGGDPLPYESTDPNVHTITKLVGGWNAARAGENGGVGFLSENIDVKELGTFDAHLVLDGRNAAAVDIARHCSLPADLLDAAGPASFTYSNSRDNDRRAIDYGGGLYLAAISAALSQDRIVAKGTRVSFDLEEWLEGQAPGQAVPAATPPAAGPVVTPAAPASLAAVR